MKLITVGIDEIIPYENNPRFNDDAVADVARSIEEVGYDNPIIVDENMVVLAGHTRLKALKSLGRTRAEVLVREGLTEEQKDKYRLYDNRTAELAEWDAEKLVAEIEDLDFSAFNFSWDLPIETEEFGGAEFVNEEYGADDFDDETFDYECPCCGFRFNKK